MVRHRAPAQVKVVAWYSYLLSWYCTLIGSVKVLLLIFYNTWGDWPSILAKSLTRLFNTVNTGGIFFCCRKCKRIYVVDAKSLIASLAQVLVFINPSCKLTRLPGIVAFKLYLVWYDLFYEIWNMCGGVRGRSNHVFSIFCLAWRWGSPWLFSNSDSARYLCLDKTKHPILWSPGF